MTDEATKVDKTTWPKTLFVFHGMPGCGKSTLAESLQGALKDAGLTAPVVNSDNIRTELAGESYHKGKPQSKIEATVAKTKEMRLRDALADWGTAISDDTNLNRKTVNLMRRIAEESGAGLVHVFVRCSLETALERNDVRGDGGGRRVPEFVIEGMHKSNYDGSQIKMENFVEQGELVWEALEDGNIQTLFR